MAADNFDPEYLKINPNGTVPSLTSPSLSAPLTESTDILRYLDGLKSDSSNSSLVPATNDPETKTRVQKILDLVHSSDLDTNVILLQARDAEELREKQNKGSKAWIESRQNRLDKERAAHPEHSFYGPKSEENGTLLSLYKREADEKHSQFFEDSAKQYVAFAAGLDKLESLIVLPYAAGETVTEADFHIVPLLAHAMAGAGTKKNEIQNFEVLEALIQKSAPGFKVGTKTKTWWSAIAARDSFKAVFSTLH